MNSRIIITLCVAWIISIVTVNAQKRNMEMKQLFPVGNKLSPDAARNFKGQAYLAPLTTLKELNVPVSNVTFEPGCRNNWHSHTGGQLLIVTAGKGYYQERGKPVQTLSPGDVVEIAPDVVHWHGATADSWFAHLAVSCNSQTNKTSWYEAVDDAQYPNQKSALSEKQQSIVSMASLAAAGDLDNLKSALAKGLDAGMTVNEIKEVLVHIYAYCGFPRSLRGLQAFMTLLDERKAQNIKDVVGREASPVVSKKSKYDRGRDILAELSGVPADAPKVAYAEFAPEIERFLKEHLFADIFERDILSYSERELATVAALVGVGGVEPMMRSHMGICKHIGISNDQLTEAIELIAKSIEADKTNAARAVLAEMNEDDKQQAANGVTIQKVSFKNRMQIPVVGNLYFPAGYDKNKKYAAIVVGHLFGGVKEQTSGLHAQKMAESGYVALDALFDKIDEGVLISHSAGGFTGWMVALANENVIPCGDKFPSFCQS